MNRHELLGRQRRDLQLPDTGLTRGLLEAERQRRKLVAVETALSTCRELDGLRPLPYEFVPLAPRRAA